MRFLLTIQPATGHLHPLVPMAEALRRAGHDVHFACGPAFCDEVERAGFPAHPAGPDEFRFPHPHIEHMAADVLAVCAQVRPAAVVRDVTELGGCLAAERLGLPHASVQVGSICPPEPPWMLVGAELSRARRAFRLPDEFPFAMLYRNLHLSTLPPSLARQGRLVSAVAEPMRPTPYDGPDGEDLPAWLETAPRPMVYATLGTVVNALPGLFESLLAGLSDGGFSLLVTVGRNQDPVRLGLQPRTVHIRRYISHRRLLPRCDAVMTHGGLGTVLAALGAGLPLVLGPVIDDQQETARRCAALGVGRVVPTVPPPLAELSSCVREVLGNPSYAARAGQVRDEINRMPGVDRAVGLLLDLAGGRR